VDNSESTTPTNTPGEMLREARESAGISEREMADRLNWMPGYVEAIEENRFEALRGAAFTKGYIRTYGKLLGLSEEQLMAAYAATSPQVDTPPPAERLQVRRPQLQKHGFGIPVGIAFVVVLVAVLWWWQSDQPEQETAVASGQVQEPVVPRVERPARSLPAAAGEPREAALAAAVGGETLATVDQPTVDAAVTATTQRSADLVFTFSGPCWVEVRDADGALIHADLEQAGDTLALNGEAPFAVLLGDAMQADLLFRGEPVAIQTRPGRVKAEFTVGEP
jgi:cytoskeleton protein RodZ